MALSFMVGLIAKYNITFCIIISLSNGLVGWLAANYLRSESFVIGKDNILKHRCTWVATSGILAALSVMLMYITVGIYPFGELSVASGDMLNEYIPFTALRNETLLSGDSLTYSEALGLGGNLWAVLVYNVSSPFMLFSLFIDTKNLDTFMFVMQIIKIGMAGGAFAYFYTEKFKHKDASVAVFSVSYALMSFSVSNMLNIIWLDCIIMLPLIILGVERIMQKKSPLLYVCCMAWAMITYYYIAYMICIYIVIYYIANTVIHTQKFVFLEQVKSFARFAAFSVLSAGISAIIIIPSVFAISSAAPHIYEDALDSVFSFNPLKLAARFLWGGNISYQNDAMPNVYCSILVTILAVLFLTCRKIPRRKRLVWSVVAAVLILSTVISYVNYAWHGFHITSGLPYRNSFLISFTLLLMACEALEYTDDMDIPKITAVTCGFAAAIFAVYFFDSDSSANMLIVSIVMLLFYIAMFTVEYIGITGRNATVTLLLLLVFTEMTYSGTDIIEQINNFNMYTSKSYYSSIFDINKKLINDIKVSDSDVYRIEDENIQVLNQSIYMNYGSLSYYATPNNGGMLQLMDALGYANDTVNKYNFNIYSPFSDSLLNLKYILSADDSERNYLTLTGISNNGKNVYQNTLVLPRAFAVSEELLGWDISETNPFEVQNSLARLSTGIEKNVYEILPEQAASDEAADGSFTIDSNSYTAEYILPRDGDVFCFFECRKSDRIAVEFGEQVQMVEGDVSCIVPLDGGKSGDSLKITIYGASGVQGFVSAAMLNDDALKETINILSENPMEFSEYDNGKVSGQIDAVEDCLLFTSIPYDKGWNVTVNGKNAETFAVGGGLLGVKLTKGGNEIEMKYRVRGLGAGIFISSASLIFLAVYIFCKKKDINILKL